MNNAQIEVRLYELESKVKELEVQTRTMNRIILDMKSYISYNQEKLEKQKT